MFVGFAKYPAYQHDSYFFNIKDTADKTYTDRYVSNKQMCDAYIHISQIIDVLKKNVCYKNASSYSHSENSRSIKIYILKFGTFLV